MPTGPFSSMTRRSAYADRLAEFPAFAFVDDAVYRHRGGWHDFFRERVGADFTGQIVFEIGCADASFLATVASKHPGVAFVGLDWKCKSLFLGAERLSRGNLRNVALLRGRAQDLTRIVADGELDEIWLFHPDPCDRPVELKNRLMSEPFLLDVHRVLRTTTTASSAGARLCLKTDHPGYFQWTLALLGLPEPEWFQPARVGWSERRGSAKPQAAVGPPRVRARDVMRSEELPAASDAVRARFDAPFTSPDFWHDPAALAHTADRAFAGETTAFERRFVGKRLPIYYVELVKR